MARLIISRAALKYFKILQIEIFPVQLKICLLYLLAVNELTIKFWQLYIKFIKHLPH